MDFAATIGKPVRYGMLFETIRRVTNDAPEEAARPAAAHVRPQPLADVHPLRILIAEDNRINQKVAVRLLDELPLEAAA